MTVPLVEKTPISIVALSNDNEAQALRAVLEGFNYRVDLLWIGSKAEFIEMLKGKIYTHPILVLSCHGVKEGIYVPNEPPISPKDIAENAHVENKLIMNLGCEGWRKSYCEAFLKDGKAKTYIAAEGYPEGKSALMFAIRFFYELAMKKDLGQSFEKATSLDKETELFKIAHLSD